MDSRVNRNVLFMKRSGSIKIEKPQSEAALSEVGVSIHLLRNWTRQWKNREARVRSNIRWSKIQ